MEVETSPPESPACQVRRAPGGDLTAELGPRAWSIRRGVACSVCGLEHRGETLRGPWLLHSAHLSTLGAIVVEETKSKGESGNRGPAQLSGVQRRALG